MTAGWPACARLAAVAPAGQPTRYTTPGDRSVPLANGQSGQHRLPLAGFEVSLEQDIVLGVLDPKDRGSPFL